MAACIVSLMRSAWSRRSIRIRRTARIFHRRGSIPGRPIATPRSIDFPQTEEGEGVRVEEVGTKTLSDRHCHLGEGCTYDPATDTAWWFDILERTLFQADLASGAVAAHALPWMASVVAFIDDQRQLLATENGLYVRDTRDSRLTLHVALEADNAATRSNDGRIHPCGALWIGTMGRKAEKGAGAIYHFGGGELRRLYAGISIPNAICFSPDGTTAYFTDSREGILHRVAIDPRNAMPTGDPVPLFDHRGGVGSLDGAV